MSLERWNVPGPHSKNCPGKAREREIDRNIYRSNDR